MKIYNITGFTTSFWSLDTDMGNILDLLTAQWWSWGGNTTQLILIYPELSAPPRELNSIHTYIFICKHYYLWHHPNPACDSKRFLNKIYIQRFATYLSCKTQAKITYHHIFQYQLIIKKTELIQIKMCYFFLTFNLFHSAAVMISSYILLSWRNLKKDFFFLRTAIKLSLTF